jgi:hypothetical protein
MTSPRSFRSAPSTFAFGDHSFDAAAALGLTAGVGGARDGLGPIAPLGAVLGSLPVGGDEHVNRVGEEVGIGDPVLPVRVEGVPERGVTYAPQSIEVGAQQPPRQRGRTDVRDQIDAVVPAQVGLGGLAVLV